MGEDPEVPVGEGDRITLDAQRLQVDVRQVVLGGEVFPGRGKAQRPADGGIGAGGLAGTASRAARMASRSFFFLASARAASLASQTLRQSA